MSVKVISFHALQLIHVHLSVYEWVLQKYLSIFISFRLRRSLNIQIKNITLSHIYTYI